MATLNEEVLEVLNGKLHFLCSRICCEPVQAENTLSQE